MQILVFQQTCDTNHRSTATILIFDKNKGDNTDVIFIDASNEFESGKNQNRLREEDIEKIYNAFHNWEENDKYSHLATLEEIQENEYNLNIPRYVDTFEEEEPVDIEATQGEIKELKSRIADVEQQMEKYLLELGF